MFSRVLLRQALPAASRIGSAAAVRPAAAAPRFTARTFSSPTVEDAVTADDAWKKSCYVEMDFTVNDESTVYDVVQRFAAFNVGCLVTVDNDGNITGVVSERDYVCKIALLGKTSKDTQVKEISTKAANLITATPEDSVEDCMQMMLSKDIRHLPLLDSSTKKVVGIISIKDLVKTLLAEKEKAIKVLSDFALGKGGHFGSE